MEQPISSPTPSTGRAIVVWLTSIVGGAVLTVLYTALVVEHPTPTYTWFAPGPLAYSSLLASIFSWPVLFVLPVGTRWALRPATPPLRQHLRLLAVLLGSFGIAVLGAYLFFGWCIWIFGGSGHDWQNIAVLQLAAPYLAAALLAGYALYAKWL